MVRVASFLSFLFLSACTCSTAPSGKTITIDNAIPNTDSVSSVEHYYTYDPRADEGDFWEVSDARCLILSLPPYAIHKESIKDFAKRVNSTDVIKYSTTGEDHIYLKGVQGEPDRKIIIDRLRRGILVISENSPIIQCYVHHLTPPKDLPSYSLYDIAQMGFWFDRVLNIEVPGLSSSGFAAIDAKAVANYAKPILSQRKKNYIDLSAKGTPWRETNYYNNEFWETLHIRDILQSYLGFANLTTEVKKALDSCDYTKNAANEEELIVRDSEGTITEKYILDRKRKWLLVFTDVNPNAKAAHIFCCKRIRGIVKIVEDQTIMEEYYSSGHFEQTSEDIAAKGRFSYYDPLSISSIPG